MAKDFARAFYDSDNWRKCRLGYIRHRRSIDGGLCEECKATTGFIVHHKKHLTPWNINDPSVALSWKNLMYVCKECHEKIHEYDGRFGGERGIVQFDAAGNPVSRAPRGAP